MAMQERYIGKLALIDSTGKSSTIEVRITSTAATEWLTAVGAAKDATALGTFFTRAAAMSGATDYQQSVELVREDDAASLPGDGVFNFDKFAVSYKAGLDNYTLTIPARLLSAVSLADDGVTVVTGGAGAVDNFISSFEGVVLAKNGAVPDVTKVRVSQ